MSTKRFVATRLAAACLLCAARQASATITYSIEPVPDTSAGGGTTITVEVFLLSTQDIYLAGLGADMPCNVPGQPGSVGEVRAQPAAECQSNADCPDGVICNTSFNPNVCNSIFIANASSAGSGAHPWVFAAYDDMHIGGIKPVAQSACRAGGSPGAGETAYFVPANQKRYVMTIRYAVSDCASGEFEIDFESYSIPASNLDITRIVDETGNAQTFTPVKGNVNAVPPLYADVDIAYGIVSLNDLMYVLNGYLEMASFPKADIAPCGGGDGIVELADVMAVLRAYSDDYLCPHPCSP